MTILMVLAALLLTVSGATATGCSHAGDVRSFRAETPPLQIVSRQEDNQSLDEILGQGLVPSCVRRIAVKYNSPDIDDKYLHCIAIGEIRHQCGAFWAYTASVGKEFQDLFGPGSASIDDLTAGFDGIGCVADGYASNPSRLASCCKDNGWQP